MTHLIEHIFFGPPIILVLLGAILFYRTRRPENLPATYRLALCGFIAIFLPSIPIFRIAISLPLTHWIPEDTSEPAGAIVVLGGGATEATGAPNEPSANRIYTGSRLFLDGRAPRLLVTGSTREDALGGAKAMRTVALGRGVPNANILLIAGRNTYEEGVNTKKILASYGTHRIILVTDNFHMARAAAVFRKQGFTVIPHPVPAPKHEWLKPPSWEDWEKCAAICHEYGGLLVYWLQGKIG